MRGIRDKAQTNEKTASCRRVHGGHEKILGNRKGEEWMRSFQISINRKTDGKRMGNGWVTETDGLIEKLIAT